MTAPADGSVPMTELLLRATELIGRVVVTLGGDAVAAIKDVIFAGDSGAVVGFTLNDRGLFAGPRKDALPWEHVHAVGTAAVMVRDAGAFVARDTVVARHGARGDVLGDRVLTSGGTDVGVITDVVLERGAGDLGVVGYEIQSGPALPSRGQRVLLPLPDTLAVSGQHLVVPDAALEFVSADFAGFGAAVEAFRQRLRGGAA